MEKKIILSKIREVLANNFSFYEEIDENTPVDELLLCDMDSLDLADLELEVGYQVQEETEHSFDVESVKLMQCKTLGEFAEKLEKLSS